MGFIQDILGVLESEFLHGTFVSQPSIANVFIGEFHAAFLGLNEEVDDLFVYGSISSSVVVADRLLEALN